MIDVINKYLTLQQRKEIIKRALYTNNYFYKMEFDILAAATIKDRVYGANVGINRDFYLTEVMANFSDIQYATNSLFNLSIYTALLRSVFNFTTSNLLPSSFMAQDGRLNTPIANELFDDRQFEILPFLIKNGDKIFAEIDNVAQKDAAITGYLILKGFNVINEIFLSGRETEQLNTSLNSPVKYEYFELEITEAGLQPIVKQNDVTPRVVLGFGITNDNSDKTLSADASVSIRDISRNINLTDTAIPVQFIAPRMINVLDTHLYYLPLGHYWQPFGNLEFNITNIPIEESAGFKLVILTRNV